MGDDVFLVGHPFRFPLSWGPSVGTGVVAAREEISLPQPDALTTSQVDGGKDKHADLYLN